jgi:hypothetical protein
MSNLPSRIAAVIAESSLRDEFVAAIKTALKPNATIPFLWLVCTNKHFLVCNTHRTRGVYKKSKWSEINTVRRLGASQGSMIIEVIYQGLDQEDDRYPLEPGITPAVAEKFILCCQDKGGLVRID